MSLNHLTDSLVPFPIHSYFQELSVDQELTYNNGAFTGAIATCKDGLGTVEWATAATFIENPYAAAMDQYVNTDSSPTFQNVNISDLISTSSLSVSNGAQYGYFGFCNDSTGTFSWVPSPTGFIPTPGPQGNTGPQGDSITGATGAQGNSITGATGPSNVFALEMDQDVSTTSSPSFETINLSDGATIGYILSCSSSTGTAGWIQAPTGANIYASAMNQYVSTTSTPQFSTLTVSSGAATGYALVSSNGSGNLVYRPMTGPNIYALNMNQFVNSTGTPTFQNLTVSNSAQTLNLAVTNGAATGYALVSSNNSGNLVYQPMTGPNVYAAAMNQYVSTTSTPQFSTLTVSSGAATGYALVSSNGSGNLVYQPMTGPNVYALAMNQYVDTYSAVSFTGVISNSATVNGLITTQRLVETKNPIETQLGGGGILHYVLCSTGGNQRAGFGLSNADSGGNTGADLSIFNYNNTGFLNTALVVDRASGNCNFQKGIAVNATTASSSIGLTNNLPITCSNGLSSAPGCTFYSDNTSGMYLSSSTVGLSSGGTSRIALNSTNCTIANQVQLTTYNDTTNGNLNAGTYTPTITAGTNITAIGTVYDAMYHRIGNIVHVNGLFGATFADATNWDLTISLPFGTATTSVGSIGMRYITGAIVACNMGGLVQGLTSNSARILLNSSVTTGASSNWNVGYSFSYSL